MGPVADAVFSQPDYFMLMLMRVGGLIFSSPIFGRVNIPMRARVCLILALTYLFFNVFHQTAPLEFPTLAGFALVCVLELLLGIALAFTTNLFFTLMFTAGQLIDMQIGFGIVNVFDIQNNTQIPMLGNILNLMLLIVFFAVDGHLQLVRIVYLTLSRMPIGTLVITPAIGLVALEIFARTFLLGVMVALPVLASGLTLEIAFGVIMRMVPQIHMFVVGVPLKMIVGLVVVTFSLPVFVNFSSAIFSEMFSSIDRMFATFIS